MRKEDFLGYVKLAERHPELVTFNNIEIDDIDLSRSAWNDKVKITNSILTDINFAQSILRAVDFTGTTFINCSFFDCDLAETKFNDTKFVKCNFKKANFRTSCFQGSDLSGVICDNDTWMYSNNRYTPERIFEEVFSTDIPQGEDGRVIAAAITHLHVPVSQLKLFVLNTQNKHLKELAKTELKQRYNEI